MMTNQTTLPRLLRRNAETMAGRPAIREKHRGIWQTFTWAEHYREVRELALGLAAHGFRRGDKLSCGRTSAFLPTRPSTGGG
jgi:long-chain acyl-CoA synthetase